MLSLSYGLLIDLESNFQSLGSIAIHMLTHVVFALLLSEGLAETVSDMHCSLRLSLPCPISSPCYHSQASSHHPLHKPLARVTLSQHPFLEGSFDAELLKRVFFFKGIFIYLFIYGCFGSSFLHAGFLIPDQGLNPCPLHWQVDS